MRYNKSVVDFILGLHVVLKVPGSIVNPWQLMLPSSLGNLSASGYHYTLGIFRTSCNLCNSQQLIFVNFYQCVNQRISLINEIDTMLFTHE